MKLPMKLVTERPKRASARESRPDKPRHCLGRAVGWSAGRAEAERGEDFCGRVPIRPWLPRQARNRGCPPQGQPRTDLSTDKSVFLHRCNQNCERGFSPLSCSSSR